MKYFGARYYNSDLSIWLSVDPMAGKYPSTSPYVYCANNPIRLIDPTGMIIEDPQEIVAGYKSTVTKMRDFFANRINNLMEKRNNRISSGKNTASIDRKIQRNEANKNVYQGILNELSDLENSDQVYNISSNSNSGNGGIITYNTGNDKVEISLNRDYATSEVAHELKHAHQFENRELSFERSGKYGGAMYDIYDEKAAYNRGALFGGANKTLDQIKQDYPYAGRENVNINYPNIIGIMENQKNIFRQK